MHIDLLITKETFGWHRFAECEALVCHTVVYPFDGHNFDFWM